MVSNKRTRINSRILIDDTKGPVEDEVILMAAYYASVNNKAILMGEVPEQSWREWICNSHTLMEIQ